jgi:tight adherence protein C
MIDLSGLTIQALLALAISAALLSGYRLWRIAQREEAQRARVDAFRGAASDTFQQQPHRLPWYRRFGLLIAATPIVGTVEQQRLLKLFRAAGIKSRTSLATFIALRICGALLFGALAWITLEWRHMFANSMLFRIASLGGLILLGWRLPDMFLNHLVKTRRLRLEQGMPDALDLLVICAEAGLSLNQSIEEISRQLRLSNNDVADEFEATAAEMRVMPDFGQALDNMVERTGLEILRGFVATLKQTLKFGTPLAESLRIIASEMRQARHARIEERSARLPVMLAIPMMMFILPCLLMIVGTPVVLRIMDTFKNITFGSAGGL